MWHINGIRYICCVGLFSIFIAVIAQVVKGTYFTNIPQHVSNYKQGKMSFYKIQMVRTSKLLCSKRNIHILGHAVTKELHHTILLIIIAS